MITQTQVSTTKKATKKITTKKPKKEVEPRFMEIIFNGQTFKIRINKKDMYSLTDVERAWIESGGEGKTLKSWKLTSEYLEARMIDGFQLSSSKTKTALGGGTWGCSRAINLYASYCDIRFRIAVADAFTLLAQGYIAEAIAAAEKAVIRAATKVTRRQYTDAVRDNIEGDVGKYKEATRVIYRILKTQAGRRDDMSPTELEQLDYLESRGAALIEDGVPLEELKGRLETMFKKKFKLH